MKKETPGASLLRLSKNPPGFSDKRIAVCCAHNFEPLTQNSTLAARDVFSLTHMSREKMIPIFCRLRAANSARFFCHTEKRRRGRLFFSKGVLNDLKEEKFQIIRLLHAP